MKRPRRLALACAVLATGGCGAEEDVDPRARRLPAVPAVVFEDSSALWLRTEDGGTRRLTAMRVGEFDYDSLAALQSEGRVILYWATVPVPGPDGRLVAYATNREAVASGSSGQSIWLVDVDSGRERALVHQPGRAYRPVGWLRDELVYIGGEHGVWAIDPADGATRRLSAGTPVAVAADGSALLVAHGVPDSVRLSVLTGADSTGIPPAPAGFTYLSQASFIADERMLLLEAAADGGRVRRFIVYDIDERRIHPINEAVTIADSTLETPLLRDYLETRLGFTSRGGRVFCSWVPLGGDESAAYVWALCEEWLVGSDSLEVGSASSVPVALFLEHDADGIRVASHRVPGDGDRYARDLRVLFPDDVRRRIPELADPAPLHIVNRELARRCYERSSVPCSPVEPRRPESTWPDRADDRHE